MSITNICSNEINLIAGGNLPIVKEKERAMRCLLESLFLEHNLFRNGDFRRCVDVVRTKYGITLCLPFRKPLECSYDLWGILHDLEDKMPQCHSVNLKHE